MNTPHLPRPVVLFIRSLETGNPEYFQEALLPCATIHDRGQLQEAGSVTGWARQFFSRQRGVIRVVNVEPGSDHLALEAHIGSRDGGPIELLSCTIRLKDAGIVALEISARHEIELPAVVEAFVHAVNGKHRAAILALFTDDAIVNDELEEYRGRRSIGSWIDGSLFADEVRMAVVDCRCSEHSIAATAHASGNFDRHGLPDPLMLTLYFSVLDGRIEHLIIVQNASSS